MQTHTPELTAKLFADVLDDALSIPEVCNRHGLAIDELAAVTASPDFRKAVADLDAIHRARLAAQRPAREARALATLDAIAAQTPTSPTHTETVRRAASALLRHKHPTAPAADEEAAHATPEADLPHSPNGAADAQYTPPPCAASPESSDSTVQPPPATPPPIPSTPSPSAGSTTSTTPSSTAARTEPPGSATGPSGPTGPWSTSRSSTAA